MDTTATNKKLREIVSEISKGNWVLRPSFQRNLVWTAKHKNNIIRTVLKGYPFPEVFIATMDCDINTAESKTGIVDGQQRLSTLYSYFAGKTDFKLEKDIKPYSKLDDQDKLKFLEYVVEYFFAGFVSVKTSCSPWLSKNPIASGAANEVMGNANKHKLITIISDKILFILRHLLSQLFILYCYYIT